MSIRALKSSGISLGIWKSTCMCKDCVPTQERPEKVQSSHLSLALGLSREEVKARVAL